MRAIARGIATVSNRCGGVSSSRVLAASISEKAIFVNNRHICSLLAQGSKQLPTQREGHYGLASLSRRFQGDTPSTGGVSEEKEQQLREQLNQLFVQAREDIDAALDSASTTYFQVRLRLD